ncbi:MAG: hypothetical protein COC00_010560 [Rhizobiales bacterium]|nr:hypothetical protein [Hyphomicrobiales bacterium]
MINNFSNFSNCLEGREAAIHQAAKRLEPELRMIDPLCFAMHLAFGQLPEVHDQIVGILDRNFKDYSMSFACTGEVDSSWSKVPEVGLDFEFNSNGVFAFFRFILSGDTSKVELHHISFEANDNSPEENSQLLIDNLSQVAC